MIKTNLLKTNLKKLAYILIAFSPLLLLASSVSAVIQGTMYLNNGVVKTDIGQTFDLQVRANTNGGDSSQIDVKYPSSTLDLLGYSKAGAIFQNETGLINTPGNFSISLYEEPLSEDASGDVLLLTLSFQAKSNSGSSLIQLLGSSGIYVSGITTISSTKNATVTFGEGSNYLVAADGGIFPFGDARGYGSTGNIKLRQPIIGMAKTNTGNGYWLAAADGGIFPFGDAVGYGSAGNLRLWKPIVGITPTPTGAGYWMVAADGGIFTYGDARYLGSTGNIKLAQPIVGMVATSTGNGYYLVAADGGIFPFGDARGYGSTGNIKLRQPIIGMAKTNTGNGYWLAAADGGIFPFGDAVGYGSAGNLRLWKPIVGITPTPTGAGYWMVAADGGIFTYGDARYLGSTGNIKLAQPIVGMVGY